MVDESKSANQDTRVLQLYEELLEIEQRLFLQASMFWAPSIANEKADLLKMIAAFDAQSLARRPWLTRCGWSGLTKTENRDPEQREQIDRIIDAAIRELLENGIDSATNSSVTRLACPQYRSGQLSFACRRFEILKQTRTRRRSSSAAWRVHRLDPVLTSFRILTFCQPGETHTRSIHIRSLRQLPLREVSA